jgi:ribokinase
MVLLQREVPERVNVEAAEFARSVGTPVMMDAGGIDEPMPDALLKLLTYFCPNETEISRITGMPSSNDEEVLAAAKELQRRGVANVLVTLGTDGSLHLSSDGSVERAAAFKIDSAAVVDTTGAGDCYRAAFAVATMSGTWSLACCLQFAAAASALCVQTLGAMPSMPARADVLAFLASRGIELSRL